MIRSLKFFLLKFKRKWLSELSCLAEFSIRKLVFDNQAIIPFINANNYHSFLRKKTLLEQLGPSRKSIFFVFRDLHILDWFTPIHRAIESEFSDKYQVIYVDFGSTLKHVGKGFAYLAYKKEVEKRLIDSGIPQFLHFSDQELSLFEMFPNPDMIVTSETIRHEKFQCTQRVYIPHYSVPKLKAVVPKKIRFNHMFQATRPPFCYNEIINQVPIKAEIHEVGYPKMHPYDIPSVALFDSDKPVVIYAPSVETEIIIDAVKKGILGVFRNMAHVNFIIKLHPTLASGMFDLSNYLHKEIASTPNVIIDMRTSIQAISASSSILINDFGSAGAEYKLSFGKRLIYLDVPDYLEGAADLRFRDRFADGRSNVSDLEAVITRVLEMGELSIEEWDKMGHETLFSFKTADKTAASTIHAILQR